MTNEEDKNLYRSGMCDALAIAISRRLGLPLGMIGGETNPGSEDGPKFQPCHAVAVLDWSMPRWIDVDGLHTGFEGANVFLIGRVDHVRIIEASEEDILRRFSVSGLTEDDIAAAEAFLDSDEKLAAAMEAAGAPPKP